jgi:hypothetical protein
MLRPFHVETTDQSARQPASQLAINLDQASSGILIFRKLTPGISVRFRHLFVMMTLNSAPSGSEEATGPETTRRQEA